MVVGQVKTDDKSNEITAIPELLDIIDIFGCKVTIDAMGCQKDIAAKIIGKQADYLLAVKGNQGHLLDDIKEAFEQTPIAEQPIATTLETGHGRIKKRTCQVITEMDWICSKADWKNISSLVKITAERTDKQTGAVQKECRCYISSLRADADKLISISRKHWGIENNLHWMLDVAFNEDSSRKRAGNAAQNFSLVTKIALNLLKKDKTKKMSIKNKRLAAGWQQDFLETLLFKN